MTKEIAANAPSLSKFLRLAVIAGVESSVQIHIERGDDINARDSSGMTPLMLSAARNKPAICELLLNAGAECNLIDPTGKTALEIAIAAGSQAAAAILDSFCTPLPAKTSFHPQPSAAFGSAAHDDPIAAENASAKLNEFPAPHVSENLKEPSALKPALLATPFVQEIDNGEFDVSNWEAEEEPAKPEADMILMESAGAVQAAISAFEPIDTSAEWDDIDAYLPDVALPLARTDDAEGRTRLRRLLLRAIREGSVPSVDVQAESLNNDRSVNLEAEACLVMVINDLGAEVDQRISYFDADDSFEVFNDPEETLEEEAALDEALNAIDRVASPRYEPLRIYQREFQRLRLLSANEEIELAKSMEAALDDALAALAGWPEGIARTLTAGADATAGLRQLSSIWVGGVDSDPDPATAENLEAISRAGDEPEDSTAEDNESGEETGGDAGDATFADALQQLALLVEKDAVPEPSPNAIRQSLAALRLNRRFLLELIDHAQQSNGCPKFRLAMDEFRKCRDAMTTANLKLAFFHAKKYRYSGEPLDDLAQEGNIGLLKAVDRYDWRRGFRFSTYATWWIRQQIGRYIADKARTIRVPVHVHEKIQRMDRHAQSFAAVTGREATLDELAKRMEMPLHKLIALQSVVPDAYSIEELRAEDLTAIDTLSLPDPADVVHNIQLSRAVDRFISSLSTKDRKEEQVIRMRFGVGVDEASTLEEIGMRFGVTRERIRQIEAKAIRKLQHPARSEPFACQIFGLQPKKKMFVPKAHEPEAESSNAVEAPSPDQSNELADTDKQFALDRVLAHAAKLGIPVEDGRGSALGRIWVSLLAAPDNQHRRLARKLIEVGFEHFPGQGYWK